jgi:hypothetical protein
MLYEPMGNGPVKFVMLRHYSVSNATLGGWSEKQNRHEQVFATVLCSRHKSGEEIHKPGEEIHTVTPVIK